MMLICIFTGIQQSYCQIGISPSRLFFEGKPGETVSQVLSLSNSGTRPFEFALSLKDWKRDSVGGKIYEVPGKFPHSNAKQVKLNESTIVINPGESKKVSVYMEIPKFSTDSTSTNSILYFTQTTAEPQKTENPAIGIKVAYEYGIQLFYTPYGTKTGDLEFQEFSYKEALSGKQKRQLIIKYKNTGNINKTAMLKIELTNQKTGEEIKITPHDLAIMPQDTQLVYIDLPENVTSGDYLIIAMLDSDSNPNHNNIKVAKKTIHVK
ncbi:COG1470 family protein [Pedobacter lusitanus]|nr:hypothetical protein [Pedobacter lusitanus]